MAGTVIEGLLRKNCVAIPSSSTVIVFSTSLDPTFSSCAWGFSDGFEERGHQSCACVESEVENTAQEVERVNEEEL